MNKMVVFPRILATERKVKFDVPEPGQNVRITLPDLDSKWPSFGQPRDGPKIRLWNAKKKIRNNQTKHVRFMTDPVGDQDEKETFQLPAYTEEDRIREKILKYQLLNSIESVEEVVHITEEEVHVDEGRHRERKKCPVCEATQTLKFKIPKRIHREHKVNAVHCDCPICQSVHKKSHKAVKLVFHHEPETGSMPNLPSWNLLTQMQINRQMNMLRAMQNLAPIQMYSNRMIRFKLMQNHRRQTMPLRLQGPHSSSTPTVPYSTADILYGNEVSRSPQLEDIRQNSFTEYNKDRDRSDSRNLGDSSNRRPGSKGSSRKSLSVEKVNFSKESEDNLRPGQLLPAPKQNNLYRPNGLRNTLLKGEPLFNNARTNGTGSGRDADDLIAMGTIWSPNAQSHSKQSNSVSANSITNNTIPNVSGKNIQMQPAIVSSSSTGIGQQPQQRRITTNSVKPIMVHNTRQNSLKDVEPKYNDPIVGAPASFQQRLMELSALEADTIRYERNKKVKKKVKQDRDS